MTEELSELLPWRHVWTPTGSLYRRQNDGSRATVLRRLKALELSGLKSIGAKA